MSKPVKKKRRKDVNQLAHKVIELSTSESAEDPITPSGLSSYMSSIGRKGGKIGGKRRLETMSAEQRRHIARKAAQARWKATKT